MAKWQGWVLRIFFRDGMEGYSTVVGDDAAIISDGKYKVKQKNVKK